jgi:diguanylate cyclase (GGDEF)-like protein
MFRSCRLRASDRIRVLDFLGGLIDQRTSTLLTGSTDLKPHLVALFRALADELAAQHQRRGPEVCRTANRLVAFSLAMLLWVPVFAIIYTVLDAPVASNIILSGGALLLGNLLLLRRGVSAVVCGNLLTAAAWYVYTSLALLTGNLQAPVMVWFSTLPILSVLLCGNRWGAFWTFIAALTACAFAAAHEFGLSLPIKISPGGLFFLQLSGLVGLMLCVYLLVSVLKRMEFGAREALRDANCKLEQQAATDALTGIPNRHRFEQVLEQEWARHKRIGLPLSVALIDVDFFKAFNDVYGHLAGDDSLRAVAKAIQVSIRRPADFCARFGGEEFIIIMPNTDEQGAMRVADLVREPIRALKIPHAASSVSPHLTISIGISTTVPGEDRSHYDFLYDVDMALYRAKAEGRNRIVQVASGLAETVQ